MRTVARESIGDHTDWYRIDLARGQRLTLDSEQPEEVTDPLMVARIVSPTGTIAENGRVGDSPLTVIASQTGAWRVQVLTEGHGAGYDMHLARTTPGPHSGAVEGLGYVVMTFDLGPADEIRGLWRLSTIDTRGIPNAVGYAIVTPALEMKGGGAAIRMVRHGGLTIQATDSRARASRPVHWSQAGDLLVAGWRSSTSVIVSGADAPGTLHLLAYGIGQHSYFQYDLAFVGNPRLVGTFVGSRDDVFSRDYHDHQGRLMVKTVAGTTTSEVATSVTATRTFVAFYGCSAPGVGTYSCSVRRPDGTVEPVRGGAGFFASRQHGDWTFIRHHEVAVEDGDALLLIGVNAQLPTG